MLAIEVVLPYQLAYQGAPELALSPGQLPVVQLSSLDPVAVPVAQVQVFTPSSPAVELLTGGTVAITAFDAAAITGTLNGMGSGTTTTATATFTATRCSF
jgi:hypothetical protein